MKYSRVRLALVFSLGALLLLSPVVSSDSDPALPSEQELLPLWEPSWSPVGLGHGFRSSWPDTPEAACTGDIDGDGVDELLVLGLSYVHVARFEGSELRLRRLDLGRQVNELDQALAGCALECGDVNGDGLDDLVLGTKRGTIWVFLQRAESGFEAAYETPMTPSEDVIDLWLADHTGDGVLDLLVSDRAGQEGWLTVYAGDGAGRFSPTIYVEGIGERIRDGEADYASSEPGLWLITHDGAWFLPKGASSAEERITRGGKAICVDDFDSDGDADVAIAGTTFRVYWNEGTEYRMDLADLGYIAKAMDYGDLDGDGDPDWVVWPYSPVQASTFINDGGTFYERLGYGIAYTGMAEILQAGILVDVTGDSLADVISLLYYGRMSVLTAERGGSSPQLSPGSFVLGEIGANGDGSKDAVIGTYDGGLATIQASGTGVFVAEAVPMMTGSTELPSGWLPMFVVGSDLDGDGHLELVVWGGDEWGNTYLTGWSNREEAWQLDWFQRLLGSFAPRLISTDIDNDGCDELILGDGMHLSVQELKNGSLRQTRRLAWGDDVAPFTLARLPWGDCVVGFRSTYESSDLLWADLTGVHETGISLVHSPLDVVAADLNQDGIDELVFVGLGVGTEDERVYLTTELGTIRVSAGGEWTLNGPTEISDWPAESVPYPYGGLAIVRDSEGVDLAAVSYTAGQNTNGGVAWIELPTTGASTLDAVYQSLTTGPTLLGIEAGGRPGIVSITSTDPQILQVIEAER